MRIKSYTELSKLTTFEERFDYLKLSGIVGEETFGHDRIFNQKFYKSTEWRRIRNWVISRDFGCDLGVDGYVIERGMLIHHINPIAIEDIANQTAILLNPEFLITTSHMTHNAIHYGDINLLQKTPIERQKNDTCPWRK